VSPASLTFVVDKGVVAEKVVTVLGPPTMDVTPTTTDNASVKVTLTPQTRDEAKAKTEPEAGKSWKLQVALGDEAPVGEWKATVTLKTTHSERSTITIPVDISIRGDLVHPFVNSSTLDTGSLQRPVAHTGSYTMEGTLLFSPFTSSRALGTS